MNVYICCDNWSLLAASFKGPYKCTYFTAPCNVWSYADQECRLKMAQDLESLELQILRQHSASFTEAITDITPVANRLHAEGLLDKYTYFKVTERASGLTQIDKATEVMKVLEKTISVLRRPEERQEKFEQILLIFSEFTPLNHVADEAREAYSKSD